MKKKLIIRDDDLSYFTNKKDLSYLYDEIWDSFPIHFAIVPKIGNVLGAVPLKILKNHKKDFYWIGENKELVLFLKQKIKQGKIKIWQHGFTHKNYGKFYELERKDEMQIYKDLKQGKEYLEKLFDIKIDTIVAPHDRFSKQAIKVVEKLGYKYVCRGYAPLKREIQWTNKEYLKSYFKIFRFWLKYKTKFRFAYVLNFGKHFEIFSYRIENLNKINIDSILNFHKGKVLCITTHYRNLDLSGREKLKYLINKWKK